MTSLKLIILSNSKKKRRKTNFPREKRWNFPLPLFFLCALSLKLHRNPIHIWFDIWSRQRTRFGNYLHTTGKSFILKKSEITFRTLILGWDEHQRRFESWVEKDSSENSKRNYGMRICKKKGKFHKKREKIKFHFLFWLAASRSRVESSLSSQDTDLYRQIIREEFCREKKSPWR
jgi:hypothetical protein